MGAFASAYPEPFLDKKTFDVGTESLISQLERATSEGVTCGNVLYVVDVIVPVLARCVTPGSVCVLADTAASPVENVHVAQQLVASFPGPTPQLFFTFVRNKTWGVEPGNEASDLRVKVEGAYSFSSL